MASKYSAADYAFQFIVVTTGVLIALFIDGFVGRSNNRRLVAEARATIQREIAENLKEIEGLPGAVAASNAQVDNALKFANDLLEKGKTDVHSLNLGFNLATLNQSGWRSAESTGALAHMDYAEVKEYSELYELQDLFVSQQRKAVDLVAPPLMLAASDPTTASKEELAVFRSQLSLIKANLFVVQELGKPLTEAYKKLLR